MVVIKIPTKLEKLADTGQKRNQKQKKVIVMFLKRYVIINKSMIINNNKLYILYSKVYTVKLN